MIAAMNTLTGTTVACFLGSRKQMSFDICSLISLISLHAMNNTILVQIWDAVG